MASKREIEAGQAVVRMGMDISPLTKGLDAAQQKLAAFGKGVAAFGAGLAIAGALITTPMLYGLEVFSDMGGRINRAARISGIGIEDLQTLAHALGVDFDELGTASKKMDQFISKASQGAPEATHRLGQLGLTLQDLAGLSEGDRIRKIGEAINKTYSDISQRHAAATDIFGRNGLALNFGGDVGGRENRLRELGGVMSPEDVALAKEFNKAQKEMGIAVAGLWARIGSTAAPAMRDFFNMITRIVVAVQGWVDANRPLLEIVFRIADGMITAGTAIGILGGIIYGASYGFLFLKGAILITGGFLGWLWGMTTFAASGFGILTAASWVWGVGSAAASAILTGAMWLYNAATAVAHVMTWGWIALLVALGVVLAIVPIALMAIVVGIVAFAAYMLWSRGIIDDALEWIVDAFETTVEFITDLLSPLVGFVAFIWDKITDIFGEAWAYISGLFGSSGGAGYFDSLISSAMGFVASLGRITGTISGAISQTVDGFTSMFGKLVDTGMAAWGGIRDAFAVGDWTMIWQIVQVAAELAWNHISFFAISTFHIWSDALTETFYDVWANLRVMFETGWAFLRSGWFTLGAAIVRSMEGPMSVIRQTLQGAAGIVPGAAAALERINAIDLEATARRLEGRAEEAMIDGAVLIREIENAEAIRAGEAAFLANERDLAAGAGNAAEVARLEDELNRLTTNAWIAAEQQRIQLLETQNQQLRADIALLKNFSIGFAHEMQELLADVTQLGFSTGVRTSQAVAPQAEIH